MNGEKVCELKCKYNIVGKCNRYGTCIAKDLFIKELEEIKDKIETYYLDCSFSVPDNDENCRKCNDIMFGSVLGIIDKHIAKLKEGDD